MYIKWVEIDNFRGIKQGMIKFQRGMNILIGPSNIGKSTVLKAIDLVLNPYIPWYRRDVLNELDFYKGNTKEPMSIKVMIGCGRKECADGEKMCPRFEVESDEDAETCKLKDHTIVYDNQAEKVLKADDIQNGLEIECCLLVKMEAEFKKPEGYVETKHSILNEDRETWRGFTLPMKEWIGVLLLEGNRDPGAEARLQYKSLLSRAIGDVTDWEQEYLDNFRSRLSDMVKSLGTGKAKEVLESIGDTIGEVLPILKGEVNIGIEGANKRDLTRQVELCYKQEQGFELPLSRHGKGLQNIATLILGILAIGKAKELRPPASIVMIEEPEQNLEPQMQRTAVQFIKGLLQEQSGNSQLIMTTHSPYVLAADLHLKTVIKLQNNIDRSLEAIPLGKIEAGGNRFFRIRKLVEHDIELFESLFANLVVIWEGDSEAGFYTTIMRRLQSYPAEILAGINGQGSNFHQIAQWLNNAAYDFVAVIDGDKKADLDRLKRNGINFIALPEDKNIDRVLAEELISVNEVLRTQVIIKAIGSLGEIYKTEHINGWPELVAVFRKHDETRKLSTDVVLNEIDNGLKFPAELEKTFNLLQNYKQRYVRETLAEELVRINKVPRTFIEVINYLKKVWNDRSELGQYQLTDEEGLKKYVLRS